MWGTKHSPWFLDYQYVGIFICFCKNMYSKQHISLGRNYLRVSNINVSVGYLWSSSFPLKNFLSICNDFDRSHHWKSNGIEEYENSAKRTVMKEKKRVFPFFFSFCIFCTITVLTVKLKLLRYSFKNVSTALLLDRGLRTQCYSQGTSSFVLRRRIIDLISKWPKPNHCLRI